MRRKGYFDLEAHDDEFDENLMDGEHYGEAIDSTNDSK